MEIQRIAQAHVSLDKARYYPFQHEPLRLARSQSIDKRSL